MNSETSKKTQRESVNRLRSKMESIVGSLRTKVSKRIDLMLILGALTLGLISAGINEAQKQAQERRLAHSLERVPVVTVRGNLASGSVLSPALVKEVLYSPESITNNMVRSANLENVIGRRTTVDLIKGDPVLMTAVEGLSHHDSIASRIPAGMRLVTLKVVDSVAGKGWIKPNDRVDIIAHLDLPGRGHTAFTMLQDVNLVSVGEATVWDNGISSRGAEIGFFASPKEVEFIHFAQSKGSFSLALRNPQDLALIEHHRPLGRGGIDLNAFLDHKSVRDASGGGEIDIRVKEN